MEAVDNNDKVLCLYHGKCSDGLASAWVVGKKFGLDNVEFVPCNYTDKLPLVINRHVVIVDFSFKPDVLLPAIPLMKSLTFLDHHKTAMADWSNPEVMNKFQDILEDLPHPQNYMFSFDMEKSGAMMTWDHFFPGQQPPQIIVHAQDYDLWHHKDPNSKSIINGVYSTERFAKADLTLYDELLTQEGLDKMKVLGELVLQEKINQIKLQMKGHNHRYLKVNSALEVPMLNIAYSHSSEAGVLLNEEAISMVEDSLVCHGSYYEIEKAGGIFAGTFTENWEKGIRIFSLRSNKDYDLAGDVSEVARRYGGGGHKNAAGFTVPVQVPVGLTFSKNIFARMYVKVICWLYKVKKD